MCKKIKELVAIILEIIPHIGIITSCVLMHIDITNGSEDTDYFWAIYWIIVCTSLPFFIQIGGFGNFLAEKYNTFFGYEKKTETEEKQNTEKENNNEKI